MQNFFIIAARFKIYIFTFTLGMLFVVVWANCCIAAGIPEKKDIIGLNGYFDRVSERFPQFKTIVSVDFGKPMDLDLFLSLQRFGLRPVNKDWVSLMDNTKAIFALHAGQIEHLKKMGLVESVRPLREFFLRGLYRIKFKILEKKPKGPFRISVSSPRNSFGKRLLHIEQHIRPPCAYRIRRDSAGNRWVEVKFPDPEHGQRIKLDFYFIYKMRIKQLLRHSIAMTAPGRQIPERSLQNTNGSSIAKFLKSSEKIESSSTRIKSLAKRIIGDVSSPVRAYRRVDQYIERSIDYHSQKKAAFFGGEKVYRAMGKMYQPSRVTLERKLGACPDICILEAALLRAAGFPSRTAGRWGHFYTLLYHPGKGWLSPSVTPTGIPLVRDLDYRQKPFVQWRPHIKVQTTSWWGQVQVRIKKFKEVK